MPRRRPRPDGFALLETALGTCSLAWSADGLVHLGLPRRDPETARQAAEAFAQGAPEAPPPRWLRPHLTRIRRHLAGKPQDLREVPVDLSGTPPFFRKVYEAARAIPCGETASYGDLAAAAGSPGGSRAAGQAMARNPVGLVIPCHRVLAAGGKPGGFGTDGGLDDKETLLALEGVQLHPDPVPPPPPRRKDGLAFDPEDALDHLRGVDPKLAALIDVVGPLGWRAQPRSPFRALLRSICYQQVTGAAGKAIHTRVRGLFGGKDPSPEDLVDLDVETLRGAGLSRAKSAAALDLSRHALEGTVPSLRAARRMDDEELIERLVQVRGIGRWSVQMFLMFTLGRPDVLPLGDYGVRKGLGALLGRKKAVPDEKTLARRGARWAPYRSAASWYLWRAAEGALG